MFLTIVLVFFLVLFSILADGYLDDEWMDGWIGLDWIGCTIASSPLSGSRFFSLILHIVVVFSWLEQGTLKSPYPVK